MSKEIRKLYICVMLKKWVLYLLFFISAFALKAGEPTSAPSNPKAGTITCVSAVISWTNGDGGWRMAIVKEGSAVDEVPVDGTNYTAFSDFTAGDEIGSGNYVSYNNITTNFELKNLKPNTTYYVSIFEHDGASSPDYLTSSYASFSFTTYNIELDFDFVIDDSCSKTNTVTFTNKSKTNFSGITYTWVLKDGNTKQGKDITYTYNEGGNYQVMLVAAPSYGCTDNYTKNDKPVKIIPRPISRPIEKNNQLAQCLEGNLFQFADNTSLINLPKIAYTRTWYWTPTDSSTLPRPVKSFPNPGIYKIGYRAETYYDNVRTGCDDTASLYIRVIDNPSSGIDINDSIQCFSSNSFIFDNVFPGLTKFSWDLGDGTTSVLKQITHSYSAVGVYPIIHEAESPEGCKSKDTVYINVKPNVDPSFTGLPGTTCEGGNSALLNPADPNGTFSSTSGTFSGFLYQPGTFGTHTVKYVVNDSFCKDSSEQTIIVYEKPKFSLGRDTIICDNDNFQLAVTAPGTLQWEDGGTDNPRPIDQPGLYWAEVDNLGCISRDTINVGYELTPIANLPEDTLICKGQILQLKQYWPNATITWSNGSNDTVIYVTEPGFYSVAVSNFCGTAGDVMEVIVSDGYCDIFMPNAFTPNGDGRNEYFEILGRDIEPILLQIFNRWGEMIYDSERSGDYKWYGDANGELCQEGLYPFIYRYQQKVGDRYRRKTVKGAVLLLR